MMRRLIGGLVLMVPLALLVGCGNAPAPSPNTATTTGGGFKNKETGHTATQAIPNVPPPPSK